MDPLVFASTLAKALDAGDVACCQLRLEKADDATILRAIEILMPIAHDRDVSFILNDRADLAKKMDCDGVHLGLRDMNIREARQLLGDDKTIGATCLDSRHIAMQAAERGADYVSFGPFFAGRSPFYPPEVMAPGKVATTDIISWWQETMEIPCVAAGGLTPANCADIVKAGADFVCASTAIWTHPQGAAAAVRAFNDAIAAARG